ncbi:RidA family protein [Hydrogenophaga sp.]|uniref:RidA family protein n=1 Tax=Hydrogenophaga sp. TaxID=1904254 RepID=UPI0027287394|nr:RidA family protein [Hydrogenophaga sp.]MDO9437908.1 RidA family protein [Hydrogenophaga sp.]
MPKEKILTTEVDEVAPGLWSNAMKCGDMLFISGQVSREFHGQKIVGETAYEQSKYIFTRIKHIVAAAGASMDQIVKMVIYVTDMKDNQEVWKARREFFTGDFPTSTLVQVAALGKPEIKVEIETVAYLK